MRCWQIMLMGKCCDLPRREDDVTDKSDEEILFSVTRAVAKELAQDGYQKGYAAGYQKGLALGGFKRVLIPMMLGAMAVIVPMVVVVFLAGLVAFVK